MRFKDFLAHNASIRNHLKEYLTERLEQTRRRVDRLAPEELPRLQAKIEIYHELLAVVVTAEKEENNERGLGPDPGIAARRSATLARRIGRPA